MKMVKIKVKEEFRDKYTGLILKPGKVLEVTDARLREIRRSGKDLVEVVKEAAPPKEKK